MQFSWKPPDFKYANMRSYMWGRMRDWLPRGSIDDTPALEQDLTGPGYTHNRQDQLLLESKEHMKKRALASPDDGDALALTFAFPVSPKPEDDDVKDRDMFNDRSRSRYGWTG